MGIFKQCALSIYELRCWNLVNHKGKPVRVEIYILQDIQGNNIDYTPIELTPEVLEKCKIKYGQQWSIEIGSESLENNVWATRFALFYRGVKLRPIKYLHQLQNIFFALEGEELKIDIHLLT